RDPSPRRRRDVGERPHARRVLPAEHLAHDRDLPAQGGGSRRSVRPPRPRPRRRAHRSGGRRPPRDRARPLRGESGAPNPAQAGGLPQPGRTPGRAQEGRPAQGAQGAAVLKALAARSEKRHARAPHCAHTPVDVLSSSPHMRKLGSRAVARSYFGTDGVRGVVGEFITPELVEKLGKASALWSGRGRAFIGRDTRASGPELEEAFARGVASAGGSAVLAGVVPTPAVALLRLDLG